MSTGFPLVYEWKALPWKKFERHVFKLQMRIYRASRRGDTKTLHRLQRLLMKSQAARFVAVRRVTQDNQGKKTAGVDGVKDLQPIERLDLALALKPSPKNAQPVRRVWIPKPGKPDKRPLGIPMCLAYCTSCQSAFGMSVGDGPVQPSHPVYSGCARSVDDEVSAAGLVCATPQSSPQ